MAVTVQPDENYLQLSAKFLTLNRNTDAKHQYMKN